MKVTSRNYHSATRWLLLLLAFAPGCSAFMAPRQPLPVTMEAPPANPPEMATPNELNKVSLPPYTIEPPDILLINAIKIVPKPPHKIEPFDGLLIQVRGVPDEAPIANAFSVDPEGKVDLGPNYGRVDVAGLTIDDAQEEIRSRLAQFYQDIEVSVSLAFSAGAQQIVGEHLVGPDGRVNLGTYGSVRVTGMTLEQAKVAIEERLQNYLEDPEVIVDVLAYNSKKYWIITQGAGFGDNISEYPITGNETVMNALTNVGGLSQLSSKRIWIARPAPDGATCAQVLPVNYEDITQHALTATNYQLLPGDRLFIAEDRWTKFDSQFAKLTRPFERAFGFVSLGAGMLQRIARFGLAQNF